MAITLPHERRAASARLRLALATAAVLLLALAPRTLGLGGFDTADEVFSWYARADHFLQALRHADWAATNQTGHPGVTTMWLGAAGIVARDALGRAGALDPNDPLVRRTMFRLPVGIVTALCVALGYLMLRRLLGRRAGLLAALLWATDPFLVAHSQLLHVDALLTSFVMLALLAALLAFRIGDDPHAPISWPLLVASAVAGGLALLTKSPAVLALPAVALCALWGGGRATARTRRVPLAPLLVWGGVALAVWLALWPAAWVDPLGSLWSVITQARDDGGADHVYGNFFLGQAVAAPGPLFYPVAIALRLTPWTTVGIVAAALLPLAGAAPERRRGAVGLLALFAVGFVVAMGLPPKQFDRYVLPVFPALDCVAALGLLALPRALARLVRLREGRSWRWRFAELACWSGATLALGANLRQYHPYELAYYNPLVGGGATAQRAIPVGWGEGYEQVAAFLAAQPDGCARYVAAWYEPLLRAYGCDKIVSLHWVNRPAQVGYVVLYVNQIQRDQEPEALALLRGPAPPVDVVRIHGIDYAYIYQLAQPAPNQVDATFGRAFQLYRYEAAPRNGQLQLRLEWRTSAAEAAGTMLFAHVLDSAGQRVAQVDLPLDSTVQPPNTLRPNRYVTSVDAISSAAGLHTGTYWLAIGLYGASDGARLTLHAPARTDAPADGPDALVLGPVVVP